MLFNRFSLFSFLFYSIWEKQSHFVSLVPDLGDRGWYYRWGGISRGHLVQSLHQNRCSYRRLFRACSGRVWAVFKDGYSASSPRNLRQCLTTHMARIFRYYVIRLFQVPAWACCLFSYCCTALYICLSYALISCPSSLLFSRLTRPRYLSPSLYVIFSSPLIITVLAPICPNQSCSKYAKVDTALQRHPHKDQIEKKDASPSGGKRPLGSSSPTIT